MRETQIPENVWMGVPVGDKSYGIPRIEKRREIKANVRFLSIEPMLKDLARLNLKGIHWVIVGGESGPKARRMKGKWVENIKSQCEKEDIPFFFKQWGGWGADGIKRNKKANGWMLMGMVWDKRPNVRSVMDCIRSIELF